MKLKNVPRNLPRYAKRIPVYYKNSRPFLSGDLFADEADVSVFPPMFRSIQPSSKIIAKAKVIFCPSHDLERFLEDYSGKINARVLILGNSDRDFQTLDFNFPKSIKMVFAQNVYREDARTRILPIGIENLRLATNGLMKNFEDSFASRTKERALLLGPLSQTHIEREFILNFDNPDDNQVTFIDRRIAPLDYAKIASEFKYIASPRGNGLDTHRFWEALYRGSVPVVLRSEWAAALARHGLPVRQIESWSNESLIKVAGTPFENIDRRRIPLLWWPYWKQSINSFL